MNEKHVLQSATALSINPRQVAATAALLAEGATVPFIARYRKELTGQLDEVQITNIRDSLARITELDTRRKAILKSLAKQDLLTGELVAAVEDADNLVSLEDIYLPYRPKRRTRATMAREKGLEPLATVLFKQTATTDPTEMAAAYVDADKDVADTEAALAGARDIIAEWINEDAESRQAMRQLFENYATCEARLRKGAEEKGAKFRDYFEWDEPAKAAPSHRLLAMFRGEKEDVLSFKTRPSEDAAVALLQQRFVKNGCAASQQVALATHDAYRRMMAVSMEVEMRAMLRDRAGTEAIRVFAGNMRELLMAPALGQKAVLGMDPAFRTGCKTVCLDKQGKLLFNIALHLTSSARAAEEAGRTIVKLCETFNIEAVAIGNGTASRETEAFVRGLNLPGHIPVIMVNESGASVYSASEAAREEFPDHDLTVRGAVSIGRRLMDPLAELVKIDPKAIGVGQYQHDVDQGKLQSALDDVAMSCVNHVGVELNTASRQLLSYVSGLGPALATSIVQYRDEHGPFKSRAAVKKVPRLGPKAFEQAAGFLRIRGARNPLDGSAVHPERYGIVDTMAKDRGCTVRDLMDQDDLQAHVDLQKYVTDEVGLPTLKDILHELAKPGRDPRERFEAFSFDEGVNKIGDLTPGMTLPGIVTNVTNFGAFVDVGVHQDGLVHISQLSDQFVANPADIVKVQQKVEVTVVEVDLERKRIALSMKKTGDDAPSDRQRRSRPERPAARPARPAQPQRRGGNSPFANPFDTL
ncbi:MAG: RNA-binding transcriptional accessory protein [Verrucomicrobia bacterium]|jgi:protein Tex|nr:RNA-binding transcriptional accessory protein [Verrucomicrobiota bacterium]MBT7067863.1 RNA-binding transcriptional accessory protein [Verrucomicrobiota bacterium]MBT7699866.1 RNA-binding transcriptional accessory protein [Verrucomicrobiota bacterium]